MANIAHLIDANERRWAAMHFNTSRLPAFASTSKRLVAPNAKLRYQMIARTTGVPWAVIAVIHERESGQNFNTQLAQGDPLGSVSVHKPTGQGPYHDHDGHDAFYWAALIALEDTGATKWADWSPGGSLTFLEKYNGLGYADMGLASPYIWGGTSEQQAGKYISDGNFSATTWDTQLGCAGLLRYMQGLDPSIVFVNDTHAPEPTPVPTPVPVPTPAPVPVPPLPDHPPPLDIPTVPIGDTMNAILQLVLGNPTLMALLSSVISNPQIVAMITTVLNGLSTQVATGIPPATAVQNLILTQFDLEGAADAVHAEVAKLGLPPLTRDQEREMAAKVIRSYIANTKAGK